MPELLPFSVVSCLSLFATQKFHLCPVCAWNNLPRLTSRLWDLLVLWSLQAGTIFSGVPRGNLSWPDSEPCIWYTEVFWGRIAQIKGGVGFSVLHPVVVCGEESVAGSTEEAARRETTNVAWDKLITLFLPHPAVRNEHWKWLLKKKGRIIPRRQKGEDASAP